MTTSNDEQQEIDVNITYNNATGQFEAEINGAIVASSPNQSYLKQKVRNLGYGTRTPVGGYVAPQASSAAVEPACEFSVAERFEFIERFTRGVAAGSYNSLVLVGGAGLGKTFTVLSMLKTLGLTEILPIEEPKDFDAHGDLITQTDGDFVVYKGFSTSKALYRTLYNNNGKIIVFDDADAAFKSQDSANVLKGALDSSEPRYVSWGAEKRSNDDDLPSKFEFTGRVIFISNLSVQDFPAAILSRAVHVDLTLSNAEKIERIEKIMSAMDNANGHITDVLQLINEKAGQFKELSVRTAMMMLSIRKAETDDVIFRKMAIYNACH